jgi:hypothetical protein
MHPKQQLYTYNDKSRLDMIWACPCLTPYVLSCGTCPLVAPNSSDHLLVFSSFELSTLNKGPTHLKPTPSKMDKTQRILFAKATDNNWLDFHSQVEKFLPQFHDLAALGLSPLFDAQSHDASLHNDDLLALDLDAVWTALSDTILSATH